MTIRDLYKAIITNVEIKVVHGTNDVVYDNDIFSLRVDLMDLFVLAVEVEPYGLVVYV